MNQLELDQLKTWVNAHMRNTVHEGEKYYLPDEIVALLDQAYQSLFANAEAAVDYAALGDNDTGPTMEYAGPQLEDGIFNFIVHLVKTYTQTMPPDAARLQVAQWLEEVARGLREFS